MAGDSKFRQSYREARQTFGAILIVLLVLGIALGPIVRPVHQPVLSSSVQMAHVLGLAMYSYATDHNGAYPVGNSSTEVFQQLLDGGYVDDPVAFFSATYHPKGKVAATSKKLKPENVCWDVTVLLDSNSSDYLPVLFSTGYRIDFAPNGSATPLPGTKADGLAVFYHSNASTFKIENLQHVVLDVISPDFKSDGKKYVQLTPDGPLNP